LSSSGAGYSHLYRLLRDLAAGPRLNWRIIALEPHLSPEFGCTARHIEADGFSIDARIECLLSSDKMSGWQTIGVAMSGLADSAALARTWCS
jgi:hypothetical protein